MRIQNRFNFLSATMIVGALALPALTNGCSSTDGSNPISNATGALCCTDFKVGADLSATDFGLTGEAKGKFFAFAQSSSDFAAAAEALKNDVTTACMNIALDLGAKADDPSVAGKTGAAATTAWCDLASAQIGGLFAAGGAFQAAGTVSIQATPPQCQVNVQAQANCQAQCSADAKCDIKANPPTCKGGSLNVDCKGQCDVTATEPSISCEGECSAQCSGECTAQGGVAVDCEGRCEGECKASGAGGTGSGIQADGSCKGTCSGKCTLKADAKVTCKGACTGKCTGSCKATPGSASVKCSGKCNADYQPLTCEGGTLEGGCKVEAQCQGHCNASASAKASCTPPSLNIVASGSAALTGEASAKFRGAVRTLEVNLPSILIAAKARGKALADLGGTFVGSIGAAAPTFTASVKAAACGAVIAGTVVDAGKNVTASFAAAGKVTASAKL